uniref:Bm11604 n=1 Tax=Brugia malayi TaxID=6279 RepID=A0A1I9GA78_BRUMA|nr:Bm11604 [Brugia malayi]
MLDCIVICAVLVVMLMRYDLLDMCIHVRRRDVRERELEKQNCTAVALFYIDI